MSIQILYTLKCKHRIHKKIVTDFYHLFNIHSLYISFFLSPITQIFHVLFIKTYKRTRKRHLFYIILLFFTFSFFVFILSGYIVLLFLISVLIFCSNLYIILLVNFTLNSKNDGEKKIYIILLFFIFSYFVFFLRGYVLLFFISVIIFCSNLYIIFFW